MVNLGYIPQERKIPAPDLSYMRLFEDGETGWQYRGQYAIWMGHSNDPAKKHTLLERIGNRVARIEDKQGKTVFHKIGNGMAFSIENLMGFWLSFDTDQLWLDVKDGDHAYAVLSVGGAAGKPGEAVVDWMCPKCGTSIAPASLKIEPLAFSSFLAKVNAWVEKFNTDQSMRICSGCGYAHPATAVMPLGKSATTPVQPTES